MRKLIVLLLSAGVTLVVLILHAMPGISYPLVRLDQVFYDALFHLRSVEDQSNGRVVVVAVDDGSIEDVQNIANAKMGKIFGRASDWPWPRKGWGAIVNYLGECGAKAVAFDITFTGPSPHNNDDPDGDDDIFAYDLNHAKVPVIIGSSVNVDGSWAPFAVDVKQTRFGGVNVNQQSGKSLIFRAYEPYVFGQPSLAVATLEAAKLPVGLGKQAFLLHYYGPAEGPGGRRTFSYISASHVLDTALHPENAANDGINPQMFRDKIVLIGAITQGTYDLKATPLDDAVGGVEIQATAMMNLLQGQQVVPLPWLAMVGITFLVSLLAAIGAIVPRGVSTKLLGAAGALVLLAAAAVLLFIRHRIVYLPPASPLLAGILATVGGFAWSYLAEDKRRRVLLKALSRVVSPVIAEELARNPGRLVLGGQRRDMTVMFTDIAGFTDLSETLQAEKLAPLLNFYLQEMSSMVFKANGTLDKYIGDAIMSFWNAPLTQPEHAALACKAALGMAQREKEIQGRLRELGASKLHTRMGINSGPMAVGFTGSTHLFNYTVLGDSVNLGSRLEGANKIYGTQIMLSQSTAELVKGKFLLRKLDLLRVKGKQVPMGVYELMEEGAGSEGNRKRAGRYEEAFVLYQSQRWDDAERILLEILNEFPEDTPSKALIERIAKYRHDPPAADWDGVYVAKEK